MSGIEKFRLNSLVTVLFVLVSSFAFSQHKIDSLEASLNKAYDYYDNHDYVKSVAQGRVLLENAYKINSDYYVAQAYYMLGLNDETIEEYQRAKDKYIQALKIVEELKDSTFLISIYNELGNIASLKDKDYELSEFYYKKGLEIGDKINDPDRIDFVINLCWDYLEIKYYAKINPYLDELKRYSDNHTSINDLYGAGSSSNVDYILGRYYADMGDDVLGNYYLNKSIAVGKQFELYEELSDAYLEKSNLLYKQGKADSAYVALKNYLENYKRFSDLSVKKKMQAEEVKFKVQEYERALVVSEKEKDLNASVVESKDKLNTVLLWVGIILIVLLTVIYKESLDRRKLIKSLRNSNIALREAEQQAATAAAVKTNFVSNISHELRTPLHGVIGIASVLMTEEEISDKNKKLLESLKFSGDYLLGLINNVLLLSKIDNHKIKIIPKEFDIHTFFDHIKHSITYSASKNNVAIQFNICSKIPSRLILDESVLSEVLINLIENAIKFAKGGSVTIIVRSIEEKRTASEIWLRFMVEDDGVGIPEDQKKQIFQKFSQISNNQSIMEGAGLGLTIVKSLLLQMGSDIHLKSEEGAGATFYFDLAARLPETITQNTTKKTVTAGPYSFKGKKVLLVEDNEINKLVIDKFLANLDIDLTIVSDGIEGLEQLQQNYFDLALLDINIPGMNGYEITRAIRVTNKVIPIVAVTASELSEIEDIAIKAGMDDILIKPFSKDKLSEVLEKYLK